jgi:hypothetical protein
MRRLLRSRWIVAFGVWTALFAVQIGSLLPAASAPWPPCAYQGAMNRDPALPPCPPDAVNVEGIAILLLLLFWLGGAMVLLLAFALSRLAGWQRGRRRPSSGSKASGGPGVAG